MVLRRTLRVEFTSWESDSTRKFFFDNRFFQKKTFFLNRYFDEEINASASSSDDAKNRMSPCR